MPKPNTVNINLTSHEDLFLDGSHCETAHVVTEVSPDIIFWTGNKERLRITSDGKFIVNSIVEVHEATEASKIYHALMDVFVRGK